MSSFHPSDTGAQTFTAASARQSLFGLDEMSPLVDPMLDSPPNGWFTRPDELYYHPRPPLSPTHEAIGPSFGSAFASHGIATTSVEGLHRPSYITLNQPMNGASLHTNGVHPQPRIDDLGAISPLQTSFPPYGTTPYPDSNSSAQSEDAVAADADEDKRKRNQAASARFRQKKKQREMQMVEQSREMSDKTKRLEGEVDTLKRENTFLKRLLVEKVDNMNDDDKALLVKTTAAEQKG